MSSGSIRENVELIVSQFVVWGGGRGSRLESKLYIFNSFGMLSRFITCEIQRNSSNRMTAIFLIIGIFNFVYRIEYLDHGKCIIGMQRPVLVPLVSFDLCVNVSLELACAFKYFADIRPRYISPFSSSFPCGDHIPSTWTRRREMRSCATW